MSCPRCNGALMVVREVEGAEAACLSCGFRPTRRAVVPIADASETRLMSVESYSTCSVSESCFECPLPQCIHDLRAPEAATRRRRERHAAIRARLEEGATWREVAVEFDVSSKTVSRAVRAGERVS